MAAPTSVDDYMSALPADRRSVMDELRNTIRAAAPAAVESIAYSMPAFRTVGGHFLVSYAAFKRHYSLFPASTEVVDAVGPAIVRYVAGKGTFRFPANEPVPMELVTRVVEGRLAELAARDRRSHVSGAEV